MKPAARDSGEYSDEFGDGARLLAADGDGDSFTSVRRQSTLQRVFGSRALSISNLVLFGINLVLFVYLIKHLPLDKAHSLADMSEAGAIRKHELASAAAAVSYEDHVFSDSGFNTLHQEPSVFEGNRTPVQDAAWLNLTSVGFISLSQEENDALYKPSVESMTFPGEYPIALGVFHQLHCLNYIRIQLFPKGEHYYDGSPDMQVRHDGPHPGEKETPEQMEKHKSHCLDYLRQVVVCHGDVTPLTVNYNDDRSTYVFDHAAMHSCRNFDSIYAFAVDRAADIQIEG